MDLYVRGEANPMAEAVAAMQSGNFTEAETYFRSIAAGDEQYFDAQYYLAHSQYRQGNYTASISTLNALEDATNPNLREDGEWLKILNYLGLNEVESPEFQALLSDILEDEDHSHHQDAVSLNNKLDSFWYKIAN
jgi:thioredoxin-like negative regulator of GroEL